MTRKEQSVYQKKVWARRSKKERKAIGKKIVQNRERRVFTKEEKKQTSRRMKVWYGTLEGKRHKRRLSIEGKKHRHTNITKKLLSEQKLGNKNPAKRVEVRRKISKTVKALSKSPKVLARLVEQGKKGGRAVARRLKNDLVYRRAVKKRMTGENNPAKRIEVRKRISEGRKRAWRDPEIRERQTKALQKSWDENWEERVKMFDRPEYRALQSRLMKGKNPGSWSRRSGTHWYVGKQGRIAMRSPDEVEYAKLLDKNGIVWLYECCTFAVGKRWWTPDFYLPVQKKFVEIKGWLLAKIKRKISKVIQHYASTNFEVRMVT